jgi:FlaG/FlaF family flagellin (archaellin)
MRSQKGVSPVTGETLMVALTIAAATALAIYTAGIVKLTERPAVVFNVEARAIGENKVQLKLIHNGGSPVVVDELKAYAENVDGLMREAALIKNENLLLAGQQAIYIFDYGAPPLWKTISVRIVHVPTESILQDTKIQVRS